MDQVKIDFIAEKSYRTWSRETPMWWVLHRTNTPGSFDKDDAQEFSRCKVKYLIFLDHSFDTKARELAIYLLDRFSHFKSAKVSKFARDNEKVLVLLAKDDTCRDSLDAFVKQWGMLLWKAKSAQSLSDHERKANATWGDYITKLALAFNPPK